VGSGLQLKILFIVPYAPTRIRTRPFHLIRALAAEGHRVTLATLWTTKAEFDAVQFLAGDLDQVLSQRIRLARSVWNCLRALPGRRPIQASYSWSPALARRTSRIMETADFDVVHIEHLRGVRYGLMVQAALARRERNRPAVVWDSVDCISTLFRQAAREACSTRSKLTMKMELPRTEDYEGWLATRFDRVLVTSVKDRLDLLRLAERWHAGNGNGDIDSAASRIAVVPNGVDLDYFSPSSEPRDPRAIVISGKMSYHANVTAVIRFAEDVMPKVWAELPDARLWIVGKDPPREVQRLAAPASNGHTPAANGNGNNASRIQVTGTVEDIRPFLRRSAVAVAPIRYGTGIQNKVLEALACGTPVVATPAAVGGLDACWGRDLMVAQEPQELAAAVLSLLNSPRLRTGFGEAGRLFVERQHDWRSVARGLAQIYRDARN
jgi:polysaccharide biosynthesis protein PslH